MTHQFYFNQVSPGLDIGYLIFTAAAMLIFFALILLVESVTLQLLGWEPFKGSLRSALWMNLISTPFSILLLSRVPRMGAAAVLAAWFLSVVVEGVVLSRLRPGSKGYPWLVSILANIASYLILIGPAFLFAD